MQRDQADHANVVVSRQERIGARGEMVTEYRAGAEDNERTDTEEQRPAVRLLGYRKT